MESKESPVDSVIEPLVSLTDEESIKMSPLDPWLVSDMIVMKPDAPLELDPLFKIKAPPLTPSAVETEPNISIGPARSNLDDCKEMKPPLPDRMVVPPAAEVPVPPDISTSPPS